MTSGLSSSIATAKPAGRPPPASRHVRPASLEIASGGRRSTTATTVAPAAAAAGATVVAVVDRRPPLAISNDAGRTWREAGGGLPAGFAVAIDEDNPDVMLFAGRNRLYLSENGGIFWRALVPE